MFADPAFAACRNDPTFFGLSGAYLCDDSVDFISSGNIWGPGNESPPDATIRLFDENWSLGGSANAVKSLAGFGSFGGSLHASTSGGLGLYFGIAGMSGGTATVNYRALNQLLGPEIDGFRPGINLIQIQFEGFAKTASSITTSGELGAGKLSMWGELAMDVKVGGTGCFLGCAGISLPSIGFNSLGSGGFPLPPGTPFQDGKTRQLIFELPVGLGSITAGPVRDLFFQLKQGACQSRRIEIPEFDKIWKKSGINGCVGLPGFPLSGGVVNQVLVSARTDTFLDLDLDIDFWAGKIKGVPPLSYSKDVSVGPLSSVGSAGVFIDGLDVDINSKLSLRQTLRFEARPKVILTFPFDLPYDILRINSNIVLRSGVGRSVTLSSGERMRFRAVDAEFNIQTQYILPNTFSNDSELIYEIGTVERILEGGFTMGSKLLALGFRICKPWPNFSCWRPGIFSPKIKFGLGPLKTFTQGIKTFRDSSLFDNNQPPWEFPGFQPKAGSPLPYNPAFVPDIVLQGPSGSIPEGTPITVTTTGSLDRDGDPFTPVLDVFGGTRLSKLRGPGFDPYGFPPFGFIHVSAPEFKQDTSFNFTIGDNGDFTAVVSALDAKRVNGVISSGVAFFPLTVTNLPPTVGVSNGSSEEGALFSLPIAISDPGFDDSHLVTVDWGDGSATDFTGLPPQSGGTTMTHVFADQGNYTTNVCVTDDDGAKVCDSLAIGTVNKVPTISSLVNEQAILPLPGNELQVKLQMLASYHDPGTLDTHTARLIWDEDLSVVPFNVQEAPFGPPGITTGLHGTASLSTQKNFSTPGNKTTQFCVSDDEAAEVCMAGPQVMIADADLSVAGGASPSPVPLGDIFTLSYSVLNSGPESVGNVALTTLLPEVGGNQLTSLVSAKAGSQGGLEQEILISNLASKLPNLGFGSAIAVAGDTLAVSSGEADNIRVVYVFQRNGDRWLSVDPSQPSPPVPLLLRASDGASFDNFGSAVAVSADQSTIVVGASQADAVAGQVQGGAVYVYRRLDNGTPGDMSDDSWFQEALLSSSVVTPLAQLGSSVAIEGDTLVAGAFGDDEGAANEAGSVFVFQRSDNGTPNNPADDLWTQAVRLIESPAQADAFFGRHVAIANGRIAATAGDSDIITNNRVTLFENQGGWQMTQILLGSSFQGIPSLFGFKGLAMQNNHLLVSSRDYLHAFSYTGGQYVINTQLLTPLGSVVNAAIDGDSAALATFIRIPDETSSPDTFSVARTLAWNGLGWEPDGLLLPAISADFSDPSNRNAVSHVALTGRVVIASSPLITQLNQSNMGAAFAMQACEERPTGRVLCGVGSLASGESRLVEIVVRTGCAVAAGQSLTSNAEVRGNAIDSDLSDNLAVTTVTTAVPGNQCGIDQDGPQIDPVITGTKGDNGWYVSAVGLSWLVNDPDSSVTTTTGCGSSQVNADTEAQNFTCTASSAGGSNSQTVSINIDTIPPSVQMNRNGTTGGNGWFLSAVNVDFTCSDTGSGIASCSPATTVTDEGLNAGITGTALDNAGNSTQVSQNVPVDLTLPVIGAMRTTANSAGWNNGNVTVSFTCSDAHSGIASCTTPVVLTADGSGQSVNGIARDNAGQQASLSVTDINIDKTPPDVQFTAQPVANAMGWQRQPVTLSFTCSDALAGVVECPGDVLVGSEGANQSVNVSALDAADNSNLLAAGPVNMDYTVPQINATVTPAPNADGLRALPVTVTFNCSDALSGIASCPTAVVLSTPGTGQSLTGTATDMAGNTADLLVQDINVGIPAISLLVGNMVLKEGDFIDSDLARVSALVVTDGPALIDWGDGSSSEIVLTPSGDDGLVNARHAFADNGQFTVTITVTTALGTTMSAAFTVTVSNVAPVFSSLGLSNTAQASTMAASSISIALDQTMVVDFAFSDAGSADSHTATVDWGDGTGIETVQPSESPIGAPSPGGMIGSVFASHKYTQVGDYSGQVCVRDDDKAQTCAAFVVTVTAAELPIPPVCTAAIGTPTVGASTITVPLDGTVTQVSGSITSMLWEDGDSNYQYDDPTIEDPTVTFTLDGSAVYNLGVSFTVNVQNTNGQTPSCSASVCAVVSADGTAAACALLASPVFINVPSLGTLAIALLVLLMLLAAVAHYRMRRSGRHCLPFGAHP